MRITNNILNTSFLRNLSGNLKQMSKYQNQLTSGKEVSTPSENPLLVSRIMSMSNNILQNKQYKTNIKDSIGWVDSQDSSLGDITGTLNRVRDLIIYGANGSQSDTDKAAINDEIKMQVEQLVDILNTNFDGRYIFAGQETTTQPFKVDWDDGESNIKYNGDDNNISREISQGVTIDLITSGEELIEFLDSEGDNMTLGKLMYNVVDAMNRADGSEDLSNKLLADIDKSLDTVIRVRSRVGAIHNRLEAAQSRNESENLNLTSLLSEREDIDVAEKYMEYMSMSVAYQASLSVGAKILQPSLLDYMR